MSNIKYFLTLYILDENGAAAIEYGLLAGLIAVGIILAATSVGSGLSTLLNGVGNKMNTEAQNID